MSKHRALYVFYIVTAILIAVNIYVLCTRLTGDTVLTHSSTQTMYADIYPESGEYPDLFLRNIIKGKEVRIARGIKTYDEYASYGRDEEDGNPFDKKYLIENDYSRWFELYAGKVTVDTSLPAGKETEELLSPLKGNFVKIGEANDMLRYSFALNHESVQQASAFWYSWYYNAFSEKVMKEKNKDMLPDIYVNLDDVDTDVYVAVWTDREDLYLMSEGKYRSWF